MFLEGKAAYHLNGAWEYEKYKESLKDNLGVARLPKIASKQMRSFHSITYLAFPNNSLESKKSSAIKSFIQKTRSMEFNEKLSKSVSSLPVRMQPTEIEKLEEESEDFATIY